MRPLIVARDERGSVLVEATIMLPILIIFVMGAIEFLWLFYDWNAATKAAQIGARLAAVSNPVAQGLGFYPATLITRTSPPGTSMPAFSVVCDGAEEICSCQGTCPGGIIRFDNSAMRTLVYGRGSTGCGDATSSYSVGMCDILTKIRPANVRVEYKQPPSPQGLGYIGRPGGAVPTVKISIVNLPASALFLSGVFRQFPEISATATAEDLSSCAPNVYVCASED